MQIESIKNEVQNEAIKNTRTQSSFLQKFDRFISWFEQSFLVLSVIILFTMLFAVSYGAIGRYFFSLPTAWTVELSEYMMVYMCFFSVPWILKQGGHVQVDIVLNAVNQRTHRWLNLITVGIALICCILLFWFSLRSVIDHYQRNVIMMNVLQIPKYLLMVPIPIGSLFLALRFSSQFLHLTRER